MAIIRSYGPRSYLIELADGHEVRRHLDHIRERSPHLLTEVEEDAEEWVNTNQTHVLILQPQPAGGSYSNIQGKVPPQ